MFHKEGGVRVCGIAVLGYFWCGVAVIFISKYGIAVFRVQAVGGKFEFHVAVVGEISLRRGDLLLFHDKRIQILKRSPWLTCVTYVSSTLHSRGSYFANSSDKSFGL